MTSLSFPGPSWSSGTSGPLWWGGKERTSWRAWWLWSPWTPWRACMLPPLSLHLLSKSVVSFEQDSSRRNKQSCLSITHCCVCFSTRVPLVLVVSLVLMELLVARWVSESAERVLDQLWREPEPSENIHPAKICSHVVGVRSSTCGDFSWPFSLVRQGGPGERGSPGPSGAQGATGESGIPGAPGAPGSKVGSAAILF